MDVLPEDGSLNENQVLLSLSSNAGTGGRTYLSKDILTKTSPYFAAQLAGHSNTESGIVISYPGMTRGVAEVLVKWVLFGVTFLRSSCREQAGQRLAVSLWNIGEACDMPKLQDEAMSYLYKSVDEFWLTLNAIREAYEHSTEGSYLRQLIVTEILKGLKVGKEGLLDNKIDGEESELQGYPSADFEDMRDIPGL